MQYQKIIEQLGYSKNEAKVYLAALSLGEAHISDIAIAVNMPRSTAQTVVDKLHKDGLMNFYVMRRYKYWVAENPSKLLDNLRKREDVLAHALPDLSALRLESRKPKILEDEFYKESLHLIKSYTEASHQPTLVTNSDVEIIYVNHAWEHEYGYTLKEIAGENPRILHSGQTPQAEFRRLWSALKADRLFQSDKIIDRRKDGSFCALMTSVFMVSHGNRNFYIQILNNIGADSDIHSLRQTLDSKLKKTG